MSLGVTADIDVETDVLRHGRFAPVTANVILADVRGGVAVLLQRLGDRDRLWSNVLALLRPDELRLFLADPAPAVAVEIPHDVNVIVDPRRVLSGQHGRPRRRAVRLGIGMRETQPFLRQPSQVGRHVLFAVRSHRHLVHADVIPAQVIDHVDDDVGLVRCLCGDTESQYQKYRRSSHH